MFFQNLYVFRLTKSNAVDYDSLTQALEKRPFVECGSQDRLSAGFIPPAPHAPDLIAYQKQSALLVALKIEEKVLPASVIKEHADKRVAEIEARERRKVGKKEFKEIKERVAEELLPRAFTKSKVIRGVIDPDRQLILVDQSTPSKAELFIQMVREALGSLPTKLVQTKLDPVTAMTTWLEHDAPPGFSIDSETKMVTPGDGGAEVSCKRHDLASDEVLMHLKSGKLVKQLALSWDERLSFNLTDKLQIKKLAFLDLLQDQIKDAEAEDAEAMFDTTFTIMAEEAFSMVEAILLALGGELDELVGAKEVRKEAVTEPAW